MSNAGVTTNYLSSPTQTRSEDSFAISFAPLALEKVYALADAPSNGAIVVMSGTVRNQTDGKPVVALEYQAYEPMAIQIFRQIASELRQHWTDVNRVAIEAQCAYMEERTLGRWFF